jgi:hypothetical protein
MRKEHDDIELTNKIRSFLVRKGRERFGSASPFKDRTEVKGGTHTMLMQLGQPKLMQTISDRDKAPHYFRAASPHFNSNR